MRVLTLCLNPTSLPIFLPLLLVAQTAASTISSICSTSGGGINGGLYGGLGATAIAPLHASDCTLTCFVLHPLVKGEIFAPLIKKSMFMRYSLDLYFFPLTLPPEFISTAEMKPACSIFLS